MRGGQKFAKWTTSGGELKEAPLNSNGKIVVQTETWYASYLGSSGVAVTVSLETADEKMAQRRFAELTKTSALIRAGELTSSEARKSESKKIPLIDLVNEFGDWMRGNGRTPQHVNQTVRVVREMFEMARWKTLGNIVRRDMVRVLVALRGKVSERSRQYNCNALSHFGKFLVDELELLDENPFRSMFHNKTEDRRHLRRALTVEEIGKLLSVAKERSPLRADTYQLLILTGLRVGELRKLCVDDLHLEYAVTPCIKLKGRNEKNRKGSTIPLEKEVVEIFRRHIQGKSRGDVVIHVPHDLHKRLIGDLKAAGIEQGRYVEENGIRRKMDVVDVHSFRVTFCTLMAIAGVPLVVAQKRMRHSTPTLTANVYSMLTEGDLVRAEYKISGMIKPSHNSSERKTK